jgi:hypothetical protein
MAGADMFKLKWLLLLLLHRRATSQGQAYLQRTPKYPTEGIHVSKEGVLTCIEGI